MSRRPIQGGFESGPSAEEPSPDVSTSEFKDALAQWASTVTIVAARGQGRLLATTVTSFAPVSADPPVILVSLGASAQVLPVLQEGATFVVNFLSNHQKRLASVYADSFPVGPSPFPEEGLPVIADALVALTCTVLAVHPTAANARLVTGQVTAIHRGDAEGEPLLYWRRGYTGVEGD